MERTFTIPVGNVSEDRIESLINSAMLVIVEDAAGEFGEGSKTEIEHYKEYLEGDSGEILGNIRYELRMRSGWVHGVDAFFWWDNLHPNEIFIELTLCSVLFGWTLRATLAAAVVIAIYFFAIQNHGLPAADQLVFYSLVFLGLCLPYLCVRLYIQARGRIFLDTVGGLVQKELELEMSSQD